MELFQFTYSCITCKWKKLESSEILEINVFASIFVCRTTAAETYRICYIEYHFPSSLCKNQSTPIFKTFRAKFNFSPLFGENRSSQTGRILWRHNYVTSWPIAMFWYVWVEETLTYTIVVSTQLYGCRYQNYRGVVTLPLDTMLLENGSGRRG